VNIKTARSAESRQQTATPASTKPAPTSVMSSDIQAATELSMEELSRQTDVLRSIDKNTKQTTKNTAKPPSAGGQAPAPDSEEVIKAKADADDDSKLAKMLGKLEKSLNSQLGTGFLALGAAMLAMRDRGDDQPQAVKDVLAATGRSDEIDTNILGGTGTSKQIADFKIASTRFTTDDKGRRVVGAAELEANAEKKEQIKAMIESVGGPDSEKDSELLEKAFIEGDTKTINRIEDKYREVGQEGSNAYQFRAAEESFGQADAVAVARDFGIETPDLLNADQDTKDKFIADMLGKQQELMKQYSTGLAGQGKNLDRRASLIGDQLFKSSRLDQVVESAFDEEGRGSFFGRSDEESQAFDRVKAELESYTKGLKASGMEELEANNKIADELKRLEGLSADQMLSYQAPLVNGQTLESMQDTANAAQDARAAALSAPSTPAPVVTPTEPRDKDTITTGLSINTEARDDTAMVLRKVTGFITDKIF